MLFSSPIFLFAFLPVTLAGYYLLDRKFKNIFLLIMSLIFYAWGEPKFIFIMLISIMANWLFGLAVDKFRDNKRAAHGYLTLMVLWNVSIFFVYKYLNFTITNVNALFGTTFPLTKFVLPIGISFFTFQAMSYVIDVYRGNGSVQKNPLNVALYITFFPQLIAGPIVRYETVANEIKNRKETFDLLWRRTPLSIRKATQIFPPQPHGLVRLHMLYRYILISADTPIWLSVWDLCLVSILMKTSTILISQSQFRNFGEDGTSLWEHGSGIMYIFLWAVQE